MEQIFYVVWCHQPVAVGCLWSPFQGYITGGFVADRHLLPACGHRLYLFRSCLRKKALKAQQPLFTGSPVSSTSQQFFVCETLYELFSAYVSKEGASPPLFLVRIRKIEMAALGNIKYENMT